jgi:hypothetical protein
MKRMIHSRIKRAPAKSLAWLGMVVLMAALPAPATHAQKELPSLPRDTASTQIIDSLIPWLLNENQQLRGIPFAEVILDTTGKHVLGVDPKNETDQRVIKQISAALDEVMKRANRSDSAIQSIGRINEVSSHFEDWLRALLNSTPGLNCDFPRTADGKVQRSGYPDLWIVDLASNKIHDDAVHLVASFEHEPRKEGHWNFTRWDLVDLAHLNVKLKAEFQGSNRDMYRREAIVATSAK